MSSEPCTVTGKVTNTTGAGESAVAVLINSLGVGSTTGSDGRYSFDIPAAMYQRGQQVTITASRSGLTTASAQITLADNVTQDFRVSSTSTGI